MNSKIRYMIACFLLLVTVNANAIVFNFDYTFAVNGFFDINTANGQSARDLLNDAGGILGARLDDQLGAITSAGSNQFNAVVFDPSNPANDQTIDSFSVAANTLTVFVGGSSLGGSLGLGGPGGFSASGNQAFLDTFARGQGDVTGPSADDFAPWGGSIAFNQDAAWYFDDDPSTVEAFPGLNDFYSVVLHELGHLLGIGTADSWDNQITGSNFTGTAAVAEFGGVAVPLDGDGSHWAEDTGSFVNGVAQEAALDPNITVGTRKRFTDLDFAALDDIGWEVNSAVVPVPPALLLFCTALLGLGAMRKKRIH